MRRKEAAETETIWATQKAIAELFGVTVPNISYHFKNIFLSGELSPDMAIKEILFPCRIAPEACLTAK
ncbi:MAG: hypothetical protein MJZ03_04790 [archaeon]|nr:hypothetical protein [archaeon]